MQRLVAKLFKPAVLQTNRPGNQARCPPPYPHHHHHIRLLVLPASLERAANSNKHVLPSTAEGPNFISLFAGEAILSTERWVNERPFALITDAVGVQDGRQAGCVHDLLETLKQEGRAEMKRRTNTIQKRRNKCLSLCVILTCGTTDKKYMQKQH